jgi:hypothetical protein
VEAVRFKPKTFWIVLQCMWNICQVALSNYDRKIVAILSYDTEDICNVCKFHVGRCWPWVVKVLTGWRLGVVVHLPCSSIACFVSVSSYITFLAGPQWRIVSVASLGTTSLRKINNSNKELKRYENIKLLKCGTNWFPISCIILSIAMHEHQVLKARF